MTITPGSGAWSSAGRYRSSRSSCPSMLANRWSSTRTAGDDTPMKRLRTTRDAGRGNTTGVIEPRTANRVSSAPGNSPLKATARASGVSSSSVPSRPSPTPARLRRVRRHPGANRGRQATSAQCPPSVTSTPSSQTQSFGDGTTAMRPSTSSTPPPTSRSKSSGRAIFDVMVVSVRMTVARGLPLTPALSQRERALCPFPFHGEG